MGEHEFRHYPSPEQVAARNTGRDISIDITGPAGQALFSLSEEFGVAFRIHYEIEDRLLVALEGTAALEDPNPDVFLTAVRDVARSRGMAQLAKDTGLGRESLYKVVFPMCHHLSIGP